MRVIKSWQKFPLFSIHLALQSPQIDDTFRDDVTPLLVQSHKLVSTFVTSFVKLHALVKCWCPAPFSNTLRVCVCVCVVSTHYGEETNTFTEWKDELTTSVRMEQRESNERGSVVVVVVVSGLGRSTFYSTCGRGVDVRIFQIRFCLGWTWDDDCQMAVNFNVWWRYGKDDDVIVCSGCDTTCCTNY